PGPEVRVAEAITAIGINRRAEARVEIMDLPLVELTGVDVESDEGEGGVVDDAVGTLVDALHEAQVRVPEERVAVVVGPCALDMSGTDEAVEIVNGARIAADLVRGGRINGPWQMEGDVRTAERGGIEYAAGDGHGPDDTGKTAVLQGLEGQPVPRSPAARGRRPGLGGSPARGGGLRVVQPGMEPHRCSPARDGLRSQDNAIGPGAQTERRGDGGLL